MFFKNFITVGLISTVVVLNFALAAPESSAGLSPVAGAGSATKQAQEAAAPDNSTAIAQKNSTTAAAAPAADAPSVTETPKRSDVNMTAASQTVNLKQDNAGDAASSDAKPPPPSTDEKSASISATPPPPSNQTSDGGNKKPAVSPKEAALPDIPKTNSTKGETKTSASSFVQSNYIFLPIALAVGVLA